MNDKWIGKEKTKKFILNSFSDYYSNSVIKIPHIDEREFGVGFRKKIDARHLSFGNAELLRNYLINNPPFYISYSAARYELPGTTPIEKKGWKGADLIFDLDMHTEGKYEVYSKLNAMKEEVIRLSEEFLQCDFGLSKNEIFYIFSGNRGYHLHIRSDSVFDLGSKERREIVDYIRGVGLDYRVFFHYDDKVNKKLIGPDKNATGYGGKFIRKVIEILNEKPSKIYKGFSNKSKLKNFIIGINNGNWSGTPFTFEKLMNKFSFIAKELPLLSVDIDAAVTYDIKKLIRMPNSIHGSTGLIAKDIENIESFNPMKDAFPKYNDEVKIKFIEDVPEIEIEGETYIFSKDMVVELPKSIALFFLLKESSILID